MYLRNAPFQQLFQVSARGLEVGLQGRRLQHPWRCSRLPGSLSFAGHVRILRLGVTVKMLIGRFETFKLTFPCHSLMTRVRSLLGCGPRRLWANPFIGRCVFSADVPASF